MIRLRAIRRHCAIPIFKSSAIPAAAFITSASAFALIGRRVFAEAARRDKAIEIDSYPDRQDLNVALLKLAKREGVRISLGTDAHHPWQLEFIDLGLAAAFKAKIPAERIINFMPLAELRNWVSDLRANAN